MRLFGLLRLDTGIKELSVEAGEARDVRSLIGILVREAAERKPDSGIEAAEGKPNSGGAAKRRPEPVIKAADFNGCIVIINGVQKSKDTKLRDGDDVVLLSPAGGG